MPVLAREDFASSSRGLCMSRCSLRIRLERLVIAALFVTGVACGSSEDQQPVDLIAAIPAVQPDPCLGGGSDCASAQLGPTSLITRRLGSNLRTESEGPAGRLSFEWASADPGSSELRVTSSSSDLDTVVEVEKAPESVAQANIVAGALIELNSDPGGNLRQALGLGGGGNSAGCDVIDSVAPYSCSNWGGCCDQHDVCIQACPLFFGNALICWASPLLCPSDCEACHNSVASCFAGTRGPGPSACWRQGDCGKKEQCIINGVVVTNPCTCKRSGLNSRDECSDGCESDPTLCVADPTFVQPSLRSPLPKPWPAAAPAVGDHGVIARLLTPYEGSLVRADVPLFGYAFGPKFSRYDLHYAEDTEPLRWKLISSSTQPQSAVAPMAALDDSANVTIHGNLGTWGAGLSEFVYPQYNVASEAIPNRTYLLRLTATATSGEAATDTVRVAVGNVVSYAWGGVVTSEDQRVKLVIPEHALSDSFRQFTISREPLPLSTPDVSSRIVSQVYRVRDAADFFTRPAALEFSVARSVANTHSIWARSTEDDLWRELPTERRPGNQSLVADVLELDDFYAVMPASSRDRHVAKAGFDGLPLEDSFVPPYELLRIDFEPPSEGLPPQERTGLVASVQLTADGAALQAIAGDKYGDSSLVLFAGSGWDAQVHSRVSLDYRFSLGVEADLFIKVEGRWYRIRLTGDPSSFSANRVNVTDLASLPAYADGEWHVLEFDLYDLLRRHTRATTIEDVRFASWRSDGYMKLRPAHMPPGEEIWVDNFVVHRDATAGMIAAKSVRLPKIAPAVASQSKPAPKVFASSPGARLDFNAEHEVAAAKGATPVAVEISEADGFAGLILPIGTMDVSALDALRLDATCGEFAERLEVGLVDVDGDEFKMPSAHAYSWRTDETCRLEWPLRWFEPAIDLRRIRSLVVAFTGQGRSVGALANIQLRKRLAGVRVVDFRGGGRNQFDQVIHGDVELSAELLTREGDQSLLVEYEGRIGEGSEGLEGLSYGVWRADVGGVDCRDCRSLRVRARVDGEDPVRLYLSDGSNRWGVPLTEFGLHGRGWSTLEIPLVAFADLGVDLSHLSSVELAFEWTRMKGSIEIQSVELGPS